jgi:hypothetical protein
VLDLGVTRERPGGDERALELEQLRPQQLVLLPQAPERRSDLIGARRRGLVALGVHDRSCLDVGRSGAVSADVDHGSERRLPKARPAGKH